MQAELQSYQADVSKMAQHSPTVVKMKVFLFMAGAEAEALVHWLI